jgi:competence protein ComEA
MDDIPIPSGVTERLEALGVRRREAIAGAAVVGAVVLVALLFLTRDAPAVIAPPATAASPSMGAPAMGTPAAALYVHVTGSVRSPGLYGLPAGARVADAIDAAGGARPRADLDAVNLAQLVTDGLKIEVPPQGSTAAPVAGDVASPDAGGMVSINAADQTALEVIPGIGPVKAAAIVQYRTDNGAFASIEGLLEVSGIGPATLEAIRPYISL